MIYHFTVT